MEKQSKPTSVDHPSTSRALPFTPAPTFAISKDHAQTTPIYERFSPRRPGSGVSSTTPTTTTRRPSSPSLISGSSSTSSFNSSYTTSAPRTVSISQTKEDQETRAPIMSSNANASKNDATKDRVQLEKERVKRQAKEVKSGLTPLKIYLLAYNLVSALLWLNLLIITVQFILTPRSTSPTKEAGNFLSKLFSTTIPASSSALPKPLAQVVDHLKGSYDYKNLGWWTKYTQTLAVLEVVHAALGWVRSPVGTVAAQVASRVWTVWGVVEAVPEVTHNSPLFTTMLFAWSLTEVIRYSFYFFSLLSIDIPLLNYLRYTTFIPLYPVGAGSEAFLSFSTLPPFIHPFSLSSLITHLPPKARGLIVKSGLGRALLWNLAKKSVSGSVSTRSWGTLELVRLVLFIGWWPALYVLFTYMLKQRSKVLGKRRLKTVAGQNKAL